MPMQAGASAESGCSTTRTADNFFNQSIGETLWINRSLLELAKATEEDRFPMTPFSQHSWFEERKPQRLLPQYYQAIQQTNEAQKSAFSSYEQSQTPASTPTNRTDFTCSAFLPTTPLTVCPKKKFVSGNEVASINDTNSFWQSTRKSSVSALQENHHSSYFPERGAVQTTHILERNRVVSDSMILPSSTTRYPIPEPTKIRHVTRSIQQVEVDLSDGLLQAKKYLSEQDKDCVRSDAFCEVYLMVERGQTHFAVLFESVNHDGLPRAAELKKALQDLDTGLLDYNLKITNEAHCSEIWTRLEAVKDHAIFLGDALLDLARGLSKLQKWMRGCLIPVWFRFFSLSQLAKSRLSLRPAEKERDDSHLMILQDGFDDLVAAQLSVTFYHNCVSSIQVTLEKFLKAIINGTFLIEEFVVWGRLSNLSLNDISDGLTSLSRIAERLAHGMNQADSTSVSSALSNESTTRDDGEDTSSNSQR